MYNKIIFHVEVKILIMLRAHFWGNWSLSNFLKNVIIIVIEISAKYISSRKSSFLNIKRYMHRMCTGEDNEGEGSWFCICFGGA